MTEVVPSENCGKSPKNLFAQDLGAGEGVNGIWLAERGWQATAVNFAPAAAVGWPLRACRFLRAS